MTQIETTTERVKRIVGRLLTGNGITRTSDGLTTLIGAKELSDSERDALLQLCRQRLDGFREQRGEGVFAHRSRHRSPISGSVKVRVLTRARGRCECCGARMLLSKPSTSGPWRWTTSSPRTRDNRTTSPTCRRADGHQQPPATGQSLPSWAQVFLKDDPHAKAFPPIAKTMPG